jgi:hypothetical protein
MSEPEQQPDFHLPSPSGVPIVTGLGLALMLFGFVPDARLWRFALVTIGATVAGAAVWRWLMDAMHEYRDLPD